MMFAVLDPVADAWRIILLTPDAVFAPPPLSIVDVSGIMPPPAPGWITTDNGKSFTDPSARGLDEIRKDQVGLLRAACAAAILIGFRSSALGAPHDYPADDASQRNLLSARNCPATALLMCADADGGWALRSHTAAQVEQVNADWIADRQAQQEHLMDLSAKVRAAPDAAAVAAIIWSA